MNTKFFAFVVTTFLFLGTSNNLFAQSSEVYFQTVGLQKNKFEQKENSGNILTGQNLYITEQRSSNISLEAGFSIIKKNNVQYTLGVIYENNCSRTTQSIFDMNYTSNSVTTGNGSNLGLKVAVGKRFNFKKFLVLPQCGLAGIYDYGSESKNFRKISGNIPFSGSSETLSEYGPSMTV